MGLCGLSTGCSLLQLTGLDSARFFFPPNESIIPYNAPDFNHMHIEYT